LKKNCFIDLGLSASLGEDVEKLGLTVPTEIQTLAIPPALAGKDIVASAETGSGKTAAFLLPIIDRLKAGRLRALVLAPTRELAIQIDVNAKAYGRGRRLKTVCVVGGESSTKQIRALESGVEILIATPGRLNDLIERGSAILRHVEFYVLDEADRMVDMGFLPQVRRITRHLPRQRQTMLLTATLTPAVQQVASELMHRFVTIEANGRATTVATLSQKAYPVLSHAKLPLLLALLKQHSDETFLVFLQTRKDAERVCQILTANKHAVVTLHSDRSQSQRNQALASFRSGHARVLVATDVAARGIDVDDISFVVNYQVPSTVEDYIHRVGRTARAGRRGAALTLVSPEEEPLLSSIEQGTGIVLERTRVAAFSDGRSDEQIKLATEIGRLRSAKRSFSPSRASR